MSKKKDEQPRVDGWPVRSWIVRRLYPDAGQALDDAQRAVAAGVYPIYVCRHLVKPNEIWPLGEQWQLRTDQPIAIQAGAYYHGKPAYYIVTQGEEPFFSPEEDPEEVAHRQWLVRQEWERQYPTNHNETPC